MSLAKAAVAAARFGLGPAPGELERIANDPRQWLSRQLRRTEEGPDAPASPDLLAHAAGLRGDSQKVGSWSRERAKEDAQAALEYAASTKKPFQERLVRFWSNTLAVSVRRKQVGALAGSYEREAIRPNVLGRFEDLLLASTRHPAMQLYLDNQRSTGPDSRTGRRRGIGLNENLAREILELHTLGVDGGYDQDDVEALAALLTGWGLEAEVGFTFTSRRHQPGSKRLIGRSFPEGEEGGVEALRFLARHPSTARNLCTRLAQDVIADRVDEAIIDRLVDAWGEGELRSVYEALIAEPAAWEPLRKLRTAQELVIATARALPESPRNLMRASVDSLRQPLWGPPSPAGWSDQARDHAGPDAILSRVEWCQRAARRAPKQDGLSFAGSLLGPLVGRELQRTLKRVDGHAAMAIVLASPEFQRR